MKKQHVEILSSISMVLVFSLLLVMVNLISSPQESIGHVLSLLVFVILATVVGIKLAEMPQ
ncbi:hypothetical protein [Methanosalsum natronophilum]|uniref:hypothetical protein n=1 Tax=Methanosalsum natronophilum TaxID=768733 RepID=UPI0021682B34|nr:hypothetical protein [Methanosalsum natronophilum]